MSLSPLIQYGCDSITKCDVNIPYSNDVIDRLNWQMGWLTANSHYVSTWHTTFSISNTHATHWLTFELYTTRKEKKCIILHEEVLICRTGNCSPQCGNRELSITPRGLWRYGNQVDDWFTWIIFIRRCRYNYSIISYIVGLRSFCDACMTINKS